MNRRKGSLALSLLLFMTALLTVSVGFVFYQGRSRESVIRYRKGLASVYAAESGANWALSRGRREGASFTINGRTVVVSFPKDGNILSQAEDGNRDYRRYVNITYRMEEKDGKALITVEDIRSEPYRMDK